MITAHEVTAMSIYFLKIHRIFLLRFILLLVFLPMTSIASAEECVYSKNVYAPWDNPPPSQDFEPWDITYNLTIKKNDSNDYVGYFKVEFDPQSNKNGSFKVFVNNDPVDLHLNLNLTRSVPPNKNDGQRQNKDHYLNEEEIEFWFLISSPEEEITIELKHWVANYGVIGNPGKATNEIKTWGKSVKASDCFSDPGNTDTPVMVIKYDGEVIESGDKHDFGVKTVSERKEDMFTVYNESDVDLDIYNIDVDDSGSFKINSKDDSCSNTIIKKYSSCNFLVEFLPKEAIDYSAEMYIPSNAGNDYIITLEGEGEASTPPSNGGGDDGNDDDNCPGGKGCPVEPPQPPQPPQPTPQPDLIVFISLENNEIERGEPIKVSAVVNNVGSAASESGQIDFVVSTDSTIDNNDQVLSNSSLSSIASQDSDNSDKTLDSSSLNLGISYIGACVAPVANEANTENNCSSGAQITLKEPNQPPPLAEKSSPTGKGQEEIDVNLKWKAVVDPDGDSITYTVYLEDKTPPTDVLCANIEKTFCDPGNLDYEKTYYWKIVPKDSKGAMPAQEIPIWSFQTVEANKPPPLTQNISPLHKAEDINITATLEWEAVTDPNGDSVSYQVKLGTDNPPTDIHCSGPNTICDPGNLEYETTYYWQVIPMDNNGAVSLEEPPVWSFTTGKTNAPPPPVENPSPTHEAVEQEVEITLGWSEVEDSDSDDSVTYKVFFEANNPEPKLLCAQVTSPGDCDPGKLDYETTYYWKVVPMDEQGAMPEKVSVWHFTTGKTPIDNTIDLVATPGYGNILLTWALSDTPNPEATQYRILRAKGEDAEPNSEVKTKEKPDPKYSDNSADLVPGEIYCYIIETLDKDGKSLSQSNKACARFGEVILKVKDIGELKNVGEVDIPIFIENAGGLPITAADICLRYDSNVIKYKDVKKGAVLTEPQNEAKPYKVDPGEEINDPDGKSKINISISHPDFPPPALIGDKGTPLIEITFDIMGNEGDKSKLELVEKIPGQDCGTTIQDKTFDDIPYLTLDDSGGNFSLRSKTANSVYFYVGQSYVRGDLNGEGTRQTADASLARFIGVEKFTASKEQIGADVDGDEVINSNDAGIISYYKLHWDWPRMPEPKTLRRTRRNHQETPVVIRLDDISAQSGSEVKTLLYVDNPVNLSAMNIAIVYNPEVVKEVINVEKTELIDEAILSYHDNGAGVLRMGMDTQVPISDSGAFAEITLQLASDSTIRSTPLSLSQAYLYDMYGRDFTTSAIQRTIQAQHGKVTLTDVKGRTYNVSGTIRDQFGEPIAGVTIQIGDKTTTTDDSGDWQISGLNEGEHKVTASRSSYAFVPKEFILEGDKPAVRIDIELDKNIVTPLPASCQLYAVHDKGLRDSQFFVVSLEDYKVSQLGPLHNGRDIEALAVDPKTDILYAASGDEVAPGKPKGHLYIVDSQSGDLFSIGDTGFDEIEDLAFDAQGTLWAWAKGDGIIIIDPVTAMSILMIPSEVLMEGLTLNKEIGTIFYGSVDTELWRYDLNQDILEVICTNLPAETEGLEMISADLILIGMHHNQDFNLRLFNLSTCEIANDIDVSTHPFNDVEGIALPINACSP